ncbi:hypothetical protein BO70DRAFT_160469 [Aspergillus heteromorphus CBS 117.55]|uniref:Uncharacterized protein n=1 Tax=Aspergillus heteromorphus CBS 117.55 TaxID=1448321 RepID=A0A317WSL4_9EURO|nr:uncharacterized protein BO70DRAFT_160469 [Aspergillus heteromorphus CBS 117.55]PWY89055.1 hypothetical protein BO70DRAFT_160469 [Aspergillus heteromorphus CBS 117.55]
MDGSWWKGRGSSVESVDLLHPRSVREGFRRGHPGAYRHSLSALQHTGIRYLSDMTCHCSPERGRGCWPGGTHCGGQHRSCPAASRKFGRTAGARGEGGWSGMATMQSQLAEVVSPPVATASRG